MGVLANGFIGATGVFQTYGATVLNNAYPSARLANFARTGANRNFTAGQGITTQRAGIPNGYRHPGAWVMPQKPGQLSSYGAVTGLGALTAAGGLGKNASAGLTGSGTVSDALGTLVVALLASLSGSGGISSASLQAFLTATANLSGSGTLSDAELTGLGELIAALTGSGAVSPTLTGLGELLADITVTGTGLSTANVGQAVWSALAAANNTAGTMGEKLNDAGSGSNPWTEVIEAGYTAAEILRILAAHAAGAATGLEGSNPQFTGLDGTTVRIDGTYSAGTRSIDALDGS